ncbi:potassium channel family protein [Mesorhizobium sp. BR1-1-9]|uniref:ion channel n=1 Tax=unclassified Mesorhizobium TaxID=325217 RepID=UPI001CD1364C|nr:MULTISPECIES: ion channel [unclassified Mesorhizobium]MBZ9874658.1 potassium channel family protein [Mesorhizobium sp. BR1-1-9]MBZ9942177.1 potassium channel family protein [Mesorhizobium sp. BR1-1-13]
MVIAISASAVLALVTVLMHYEVLNMTGALRRRFSLPMRVDLLLLITGAIAAHIAGVGLFAIVYAWMQSHTQYGSLMGEVTGGAEDFFYFSVACYTTLGFGEVYATGPMRIVAALEALNGLVLITWSASFVYAATSSLWKRENG